MIISFRDDETRRVFDRERSGKLPADIQRIVLRKLVMLNAAVSLADLRVSLRAIAWRRCQAAAGANTASASTASGGLCFIWENGRAFQVEITDYH